MLNFKKDEKLIELKEVCKKLKFKDLRTVIKWCKKMNIPIILRGKQKFTYRFLVDIELDKEIITFFKSEYQEAWTKMYQLYLDNDTLGFALASMEKNT